MFRPRSDMGVALSVNSILCVRFVRMAESSIEECYDTDEEEESSIRRGQLSVFNTDLDTRKIVVLARSCTRTDSTAPRGCGGITIGIVIRVSLDFLTRSIHDENKT